MTNGRDTGNQRMSEMPTTYDGRRVRAAYVQMRADLARAMQHQSKDMKRGTALTAIIRYMDAAHPELIQGDELAELRRLRAEILHNAGTAVTRERGNGQPQKPAGETLLRCAAIAAVRFLRDGKTHGQALTAKNARAEVARILRSMGRTDGVERVRKWEADWLPRQRIISGPGVDTDADPEHAVDIYQDFMTRSYCLPENPIMKARDTLRKVGRAYAPETCPRL
ncbi:hypothetical protein [Ruegeria atlantica]|uniref:hypothetical protein n=1 Tax=Ruegeria atlantica TaxID=81569 RepID=UPI0024945476|nr:hypothetical protein [Ruegeria atlantica]